MSNPRVIDFHAHILEAGVFELCAPNSVFGGFGRNPEAARPGVGSRMAGAHARMLDPGRRLEDMDAYGIDVQVLSSSTVMQYTAWADPGAQLELDRRSNDAIAELCVTYPDRFAGAFTLPLRDTDLALAELERAVRDLGLVVANLPAAVNGDYLGDARFRPIWEALLDLGITAFIHPDGTPDPWFQRYALWNSIGQSIEEAKAMTSLIVEGVIEDFPGLRIVVAHGGGFLPHNAARLDRNFHNRPETAVNISKPPSEYLHAFWLDTCVYDPTVLAALVERVGIARLVLGTDYPVGETKPLETPQRAGIAGDDLAAIAGGNAAELLRPAA